MVFNLEKAEPIFGGQFAGFHLLQHAFDEVGDLNDVCVHLAEQVQRLR